MRWGGGGEEGAKGCDLANDACEHSDPMTQAVVDPGPDGEGEDAADDAGDTADALYVDSSGDNADATVGDTAAMDAGDAASADADDARDAGDATDDDATDDDATNPGPCRSHLDCDPGMACTGLTVLDRACTPIPGHAWPAVSGSVPIPDNDPAGVTIAVQPSAPGYAWQVFAEVSIRHPAPGDLRLELCREGLCVGLEGYGDSLPDPPQTRTFVFGIDPVDGPGTLADFRGKAVAGAWELRAYDGVPDMAGTLEGLRGSPFILYVDAVECYRNGDCDDGEACTVDQCLPEDSRPRCGHEAKICPESPDPAYTLVCDPTDGECKPQPVR